MPFGFTSGEQEVLLLSVVHNYQSFFLVGILPRGCDLLVCVKHVFSPSGVIPLMEPDRSRFPWGHLFLDRVQLVDQGEPSCEIFVPQSTNPRLPLDLLQKQRFYMLPLCARQWGDRCMVCTNSYQFRTRVTASLPPMSFSLSVVGQSPSHSEQETAVLVHGRSLLLALGTLAKRHEWFSLVRELDTLRVQLRPWSPRA